MEELYEPWSELLTRVLYRGYGLHMVLVKGLPGSVQGVLTLAYTRPMKGQLKGKTPGMGKTPGIQGLCRALPFVTPLL